MPVPQVVEVVVAMVGLDHRGEKTCASLEVGSYMPTKLIAFKETIYCEYLRIS